jgi:ABC-type glycerol-3-phosphate transport system substrate-binding protein
MSRIIGLGACLAVAVLAAAGCAADPPASRTLAGHTVEVAAIWTGAEQANFRAVLDVFERRTGATVRYTSGGDDLPALLNSRLAGGAPPDVALLGQPGVVAQLARRGALTALPDPAAQAVEENYSPVWRELGEVDGTLYGVYFKVANKSVIWYESRAFDEAGVGPPTTWPELAATTRTLADAGAGTMALPGADGWVLTDWFENAYLRLAGPVRYDQLARHEIRWTDPSVVETLRLLRDYWTSDRALQGGPAGALQLEYTQAVADVFGARQKSAMLFEGDFVATEINRLGTVVVGDRARAFDWPSIDGSAPAVVVAGDQAVVLTDSPAAMALVRFLASPEAAHVAVSAGGFLSANRNLPLSAYPDPVIREMAESMVDARLLRFDLSDLAPQAFGGGTSSSMWRLLQDFLATGDPERTARLLEAAAQRDFEDSR